MNANDQAGYKLQFNTVQGSWEAPEGKGTSKAPMPEVASRLYNWFKVRWAEEATEVHKLEVEYFDLPSCG
ncbi:hypothetical protein J5Y04_24280 [Kitasatospora sp. RG8]|uniref:hypothetical protein n=1 Tax=Kitasatospora sp. RG8 TaxID=2820815 RepID=UPI001ADF0CEB|nr:hypothetical protein [Kitasatospora sp. RG8]MBP0452636.1 hypothetical protein [Kitasatospora sp. RG8]